jgi:hypothetical protein
MLKPDAATEVCRSTGVLAGRAAEADLAGAALTRLMGLDAEANAVVNARLESSVWSIGLYGRECVTLRGDVVRSVTTLLLPMPEGHPSHGGH